MKIINRSLNPVPNYATEGSSGLDIRSNETVTIMPMERVLVSTGLFLEIPPLIEGQLRPRSGLAIKHGITLINCVGTIDNDFREELKVPIINLGSEPYTIGLGDKIAQLVLGNYYKVKIQEVEVLDETGRKGGFGSTGK